MTTQQSPNRPEQPASEKPASFLHIIATGKSDLLAWPFLCGIIISIAPTMLLVIIVNFLFPLYLFLEWRVIRRHGFFPFTPLRAGVVVLTVTAAMHAPTKFVDRSVDPRKTQFIMEKEISTLEIPDLNEALYFHPPVTKTQLELPDQPLTLRALIKHIETKTGYTSRYGTCGFGHNILWGGTPIAGVAFHEPLPGSRQGD